MPPLMAGLQVDVVDDEDGLAELRDPWAALLERSADANPYVTWEWAATWWRHFRGRDRLHVVVARDGDDVVAIAPLTRRTFGAGPVAVHFFFGIGHEAADYGGFLLGAEPARTAGAILAHLAPALARGSVVNLGRLRDDADTLCALRDAVSSSPSVLARDEQDEYPYLDLASLADPVHDVDKLQKRHDVRRLLRRLRDKHDVAFTYDEQPIGPAFDEFLALHGRRWETKGAEASGLFVTPRGQRFLRDLVPRLGRGRVSSVRADGVPIAMRIGYEDRGRYFGVNEAFSPDFSGYGPGHLLVGLLLDDFLERGVREFDFMRGGGLHKSKWTATARTVGYWSLAHRGRIGTASRWARWQALRVRARARAR